MARYLNKPLLDDMLPNDGNGSLAINGHRLTKTEIVRLAMQYSHNHLEWSDVCVIVMYGLIVLVSLFGNLVVIKVILFRQAMRKKITNIFIANLTISDLLMTIFTIPMNTGRLQ